MTSVVILEGNKAWGVYVDNERVAAFDYGGLERAENNAQKRVPNCKPVIQSFDGSFSQLPVKLNPVRKTLGLKQ